MINEIKAPLSEGPHGLYRLKRMRRDMLYMGMLLILNILINIIITIMLYGRPLITHLKDTFKDGYAIKVSIVNIIIAFRHCNLPIVKFEIMKKDTIEGALIEDVPQECIASSLMFKCMLLRRSHISGEGIQLEILMQLLVP